MTQTPPDQPGQQHIGPPYPGQPYPYYAAHYPPPATVSPFRPASSLAAAVAVLAGLVTLAELAEMAVAWYSGGRLQDAAVDGVAASEVITPYDVVVFPILGLLAVAWVMTALWLTQARKNADVLNPHFGHARSPIWAWLGWLVPVVSLWFPFQFVRDVRLATVAEQRRHSGAVGWWWAMWLLYLFTSQIGARITSGTEPNEATAGALGPIETVNALFAVAALVLFLRIIREITEDQNAVARGRPIETTG